MMSFKKVASVNELTADEGIEINVDGESIALFFHNNNYYAIENTCPHKEGPLCEGDVASGTVACPFHEWKFDLTTGACITKPSFCVQSYEVKVQDGQIFVGTKESEKKKASA
jgi:NAD(P)H-dependent nitrite reductase small subunit